ncbi:hypothetical protein LWI29_001614 [Acer saccharum]|uniref:ABC transporter domain-containing protein n=1 Tax=Acer saccharum TaxID=4024 RepID=A0AA39TM13_ACESA|nr:hypothetical protein LWI29_001614 [Acer saccharum]
MAQLAGPDEIESLRIELAEIGRSIRSSFRSHVSSFRSVTSVNSEQHNDNSDEYELQYAAVQRLSISRRITTALFDEKDEATGNGDVTGKRVINVAKLGAEERHLFIEKLIKHIENDNLQLLRKIRKRIDKVGIQLPTVEVRYKNLSVEAECEVVHGKPLPTLWNATKSMISGFISLLGSKQEAKLGIIKDVSGIIKPGRMTLLLGPPGCGKTTLLLALSGKLSHSLKVSGEVSYNGYKLDEFVPQKTSAYISQYDLHIPEMTVRETLDFSARCQGIGDRAEIMMEVSKREKQAEIVPDPDIDAYMKILGLDVCADTMVGDAMRRGISGGQKKRLTTGELIVGPTKALFMDEISNGLDSSTTFQIISCLKHLVHITDATALISLLQPAPEAFDLFDDVILMAEGKIVYHGPRSYIRKFFEDCGFYCPERKGVADFLQEVTSEKDQAQYWHRKDQPYSYVATDQFIKKFKECHLGHKLDEELAKPFMKSQSHQNALSSEKYSLTKWELLKACTAREFLLMKRNSFIYVFKSTQIMSGNATVAQQTLESRGLNFSSSFYWIAVGALVGFTILFNVVFILALTFMKPPGGSRAIISYEKYSQLQERNDGSSSSDEERKPTGTPLKNVTGSERVLETIELDGIKDSLVGFPGVSGLSTEQRKRLTIAVELVANPSIIFMDEPTSGLDARAAAIVMRAVKNVVETGRTVVCTIHQPSIDIFEAFDDLILMKSGGRIIYCGPLGWNSSRVINYFENVRGVPKIENNYNPATWMLEVTSKSVEAELGVDFAQIYRESTLYQENEELVKKLSSPSPGSKDLHFPTRFPQNGWEQFKACLWKQHLSYWRSPSYNLIRIIFIAASSVLFGILFWKQGKKLNNQQDLFNVLGSMYSAIIFFGIYNCSAVLPFVATERTVLYRERFAGMYSSWAYSFAQVLIEVPYLFIEAVLYVIITYPMIGYYWSAYKIFWLFYGMFCNLLYFNYLGMLMVSLTPNVQVAAIVTSSSYTMLNLFSGFVIPKPFAAPVEVKMAQLGGPGELESLPIELAEVSRSTRSSFRSHASSSEQHNDDDSEYESLYAAVQRLPTFEQVTTALFDVKDEENVDGKRVINVTKLGAEERRMFIEKLIKHIENDNLRLLQKIRKRIDKVGVQLPIVEVRYKNLSVEAECEVVHGKPLPTLWNTTKGMLSGFTSLFGSKQEAKLRIIKDVSGIIKPGRTATYCFSGESYRIIYRRRCTNLNDRPQPIAGHPQPIAGHPQPRRALPDPSGCIFSLSHRDPTRPASVLPPTSTHVADWSFRHRRASTDGRPTRSDDLRRLCSSSLLTCVPDPTRLFLLQQRPKLLLLHH